MWWAAPKSWSEYTTCITIMIGLVKKRAFNIWNTPNANWLQNYMMGEYCIFTINVVKNLCLIKNKCNMFTIYLFLFCKVDYYGETTRLFTHLVASKPGSSQIVLKSDQYFQEDLDKKFADLKSLSIVGKWKTFSKYL